ncbi:uncharacterized protein L201_007036 [Kwoniella dendrophila CBS 6074]|uniref:Arf-GAP domain-containing protein n=1 Tax=Kwoniella dendrophila CBS 6074 TaxID=1295534 RepID=A0AAX4K5F0_9TREE
MTMEARHKRMLEEVLKLPGNDTCADCHAPAPRWASVNLGIFLCVGCASVHRKMGTHKSRVKSVTLDTWTREQIVHMREIGNIISNQTFNPNEKLNPPPPSYGHDERDSEIEKYIRKKYEMGVFKVITSSSSYNPRYEPTSLNRAKEKDGRIPFGSLSENSSNNHKHPELNDILSFNKSQYIKKERDLPDLPISHQTTSNNSIPRQRPQPQNPLPSPWATPSNTPGPRPASSSSSSRITQPPPHQLDNNATNNNNLIDFNQGQTQIATLPLQVNMTSNKPNQQNGYLSTGIGQQQQVQQPGNYQFSTSPVNGYQSSFTSSIPPHQQQQNYIGSMNRINGNSYGTSSQFTGIGGMGNMGNNGYSQQQMQQQQVGGYGSNLSPQSAFANNGFVGNITGPLTPNATPSPAFGGGGNSPSFSQPLQIPNQYGQSIYNNVSPSFQQQSSFTQQPQYLPQQQQQQQQQYPQQQQQQQQWGSQTMMNNGMIMSINMGH